MHVYMLTYTHNHLAHQDKSSHIGRLFLRKKKKTEEVRAESFHNLNIEANSYPAKPKSSLISLGGRLTFMGKEERIVSIFTEGPPQSKDKDKKDTY